MIKDHWQVSNQGSVQVKVNVDGLVSTFKSRAAIGGVVRELNGNWMGGFEMVVGLSDIFQIEAQGLKFAWTKGCPRVEIESDNSMLDWEVKFQPILKKSNKVAYRIAKEVRGEMEHLIIHEEPPESVRGLLDYDNHCTTYPLFDGD
ncbi:hypothetical protein Golob_023511 [Gossypium lobatum]|uniref:RNase H type-1 domain-containing protein n=1 Tax=Gossypium lobatum TaxID=34289 RepID=A0A7J8LJW7_9ROSI|nr:hypothetical protein [Gossypium lobatum]